MTLPYATKHYSIKVIVVPTRCNILFDMSGLGKVTISTTTAATRVVTYRRPYHHTAETNTKLGNTLAGSNPERQCDIQVVVDKHNLNTVTQRKGTVESGERILRNEM